MSPQDFRDLVRYVMANPFLTNIKVGDKPVTVGVPGRISLPPSKDEAKIVISASVTAPATTKMRLQVGAPGPIAVRINGQPASTPERGELPVELKEGVNKLDIEVRYKGDKEAVFARFLDPDRKLHYAE
jgi:hypothetical protein